MILRPATDLPLPASATALMQHLQRLVGVEQYRWWCGGTVPLQKLPTLVEKFSARYPLDRNTRQRSYDRSRGHAAMHLIVYPSATDLCDWSRAESVQKRVHDRVHDRAHDRVHEEAQGSTVSTRTTAVPVMHAGRSDMLWWLVSTVGKGGLADTTSPDARVSRDAMAADAHLTFRDYVLLYATKKEPRTIRKTRSGHTIAVFKDTSTWTWQMRRPIVSALRAQVDSHCVRLEYGAESADGRSGWGLRGLLEMQRQRPLFAGVRHQVYDLHRYAEDAWQSRRGLWRAAHPDLARRYGEQAGALRPLRSITREHLPKMIRLKVYGGVPLRLSDLLPAAQLD